ncbi:hypothetical protein RYX56_19650, partial [Alkalihalophilus lindianensis]
VLKIDEISCISISLGFCSVFKELFRLSLLATLLSYQIKILKSTTFFEIISCCCLSFLATEITLPANSTTVNRKFENN